MRQLIEELKHDGMEIQLYELKDSFTSQGEIFEVDIQFKVKRGESDCLRIIDYMEDFSDVTIVTTEG